MNQFFLLRGLYVYWCSFCNLEVLTDLIESDFKENQIKQDDYDLLLLIYLKYLNYFKMHFSIFFIFKTIYMYMEKELL
jgi:hypothetical protein